MANFIFYFASCALVLTLSWPTTSGLPVRTAAAEKCADCGGLFRSLRMNITELLKDEDLCLGTSEKMEVKSTTDTVLACAPTLTQNSSCQRERNSSFSESECLRNIVKDLAFYASAFQSYLDSELRIPQKEVALLRPTLEILQGVRENCSLMPSEEDDSSEEAAQMWKDTSFNNRQQMCKMMRAFHARTITISRALGYISSGEHRK